MNTKRVVVAAALLAMALAGESRGQFRVPPIRPIPVPRPVPHVVPHPVPHGLPDRAASSSNASDDSAFWWTVGGVGGGGAGAYVLYRLWKRPRRSYHIRIVATPPGEAPLNVRRAWVGLELPLAPGEQGSPRILPVVGVVSSRPGGATAGYVVEGRVAIARLEAHDSMAAMWWKINIPGVISKGYQLGFPAEVCKRTDEL
jgi:hypothetical protein